jgi:hypothetical protein
VFDKTMPVGGNGSYTSPSFTPAQAGTYRWTASYSGDTNNNPAASNCGNESVTVTAPVIHVATDGSDSTGTGSQAQPLRTITAALTLAANNFTGPATVDVAGGTYTEGTGGSGLALISNVTINGGFSEATWTQPGGNTTTIVGSPQAVLANNVTGTTLADVTLAPVTPAGPGASVYGIRAINGSALTVSNVTIATPDADNGAGGVSPAAGSAPNGDNGKNGVAGTDNCVGGGTGGSGGQSFTAGGTGGAGNCDTGGNNGSPGSGSGGGVGGQGALQGGANGGPGAHGTAGASGSPGSGGPGTPGAGPSWVGQDGTPGTPGSNGSGGGGGGGGGAMSFPRRA